MELHAWLCSQLHTSAEGILWALAQIPVARHGICPPAPHYLGTWPPARHLWHVTHYERCLVIPSLQQWTNGAVMPREDNWLDDDASWAAAWAKGVFDVPDLFQAMRDKQLQLLRAVRPADWNTLCPTLWGNKPLTMVVTKTYQHTLEHCDTLLRMALWWDDAEQDIAARREVQERAIQLTDTERMDS